MKLPTILDHTLEVEAGYVFDPIDLGGETKYGITKRYHPNEDIKNLTPERAKEIYTDKYWNRYKIYDFEEKYQHIIFDMTVNMGYRNAIKVLQRSLNGKYKSNLRIDGVLGSNTKRILSKGLEIERIRAYRVKYYSDLVRRNPSQDRFYFGWFKRAISI